MVRQASLVSVIRVFVQKIIIIIWSISAAFRFFEYEHVNSVDLPPNTPISFSTSIRVFHANISFFGFVVVQFSHTGASISVRATVTPLRQTDAQLIAESLQVNKKILCIFGAWHCSRT